MFCILDWWTRVIFRWSDYFLVQIFQILSFLDSFFSRFFLSQILSFPDSFLSRFFLFQNLSFQNLSFPDSFFSRFFLFQILYFPDSFFFRFFLFQILSFPDSFFAIGFSAFELPSSQIFFVLSLSRLFLFRFFFESHSEQILLLRIFCFHFASFFRFFLFKIYFWCAFQSFWFRRCCLSLFWQVLCCNHVFFCSCSIWILFVVTQILFWSFSELLILQKWNTAVFGKFGSELTLFFSSVSAYFFFVDQKLVNMNVSAFLGCSFKKITWFISANIVYRSWAD